MGNDLTVYNKYRSQMKTGDLLLYRTPGIISSLIHIWSEDNHAGLVLDLHEYEGEQYRKWTMEAVGGGVRTVFLSRSLEKIHGEVWWHQLKPKYDSCRTVIGCFALETVGVTKYDFWSLLKYPFKLVSADLNKLLCSEYVGLSWRAAGIVQFENIPSPSDLPKFGVTLPGICIIKSTADTLNTPLDEELNKP